MISTKEATLRIIQRVGKKPKVKKTKKHRLTVEGESSETYSETIVQTRDYSNVKSMEVREKLRKIIEEN